MFQTKIQDKASSKISLPYICKIPVFHYAFGKPFEEYGKDIEQLYVDIHSLFKYSEARLEDYHTLQAAMGVDAQLPKAYRGEMA